MIPEPTIQELIEIAAKAVRGGYDKNADFIRGSDYEALIGPSAIIWTRQARRDTDLFNSVNFHTAEGEELTNLVAKRFGKSRAEDTRGTGVVGLIRPAGGISETIWRGTRFMIPGSQPKTYRTTKDQLVSSSAVRVEIPIECVKPGAGSAIDIAGGDIRILDVLEDSSWSVAYLRCSEGGTFESAEEFRARVRRERRDERVGHTKAIVDACVKAGAPNVALFRSDYAGDAYDYGLNVCYVGDLGYTGTPELVKACTLALEKVRVAGDHLQVLPMVRTELNVSADVYLIDSPALVDITKFRRIHGASILQYLNGSSGRFSFSLDGIRGAIARPTPQVQRVVITEPTTDAAIVTGEMKNFPEKLNRYIAGTITLRYLSS